MRTPHLAAVLGACLALGQAPTSDVGWPQHGGDNNIHYSPLSQITRKNVTQLKVAWTYDSHDAFKGSEMQSNPVIVDGILYACATGAAFAWLWPR